MGEATPPVTLPEATGSNGDLTYSLTPVPAGLTFAPATRVLSGTPTAVGRHGVTYTATAATGSKKTSVVFTITVRPTFSGTWTATHEWREDWFDDDEVGTYVDTLTFTDSRYILYRSHYFSDGTFYNAWKPSGGWSAVAEGTVIREWEDDDSTPGVPMSVAKHYVWGNDDHTVLFMHHWSDPNKKPAGGELERYEWVPNPLPSLIGVWRFTDDDGPVVVIMTVEADGTFSMEETTADGTHKYMAKWTLDEGNYFLDFTELSATWTPPGGTPEPDSEFRADRIALAPTDSSDKLIVSPHFRETKSDSEHYRRFGDYWPEFHRQ